MAERAAVRAAGLAEPGPHAGHDWHLHGTFVICSCGEALGVTCVVVPEGYIDADEPCEVCGEA